MQRVHEARTGWPSFTGSNRAWRLGFGLVLTCLLVHPLLDPTLARAAQHEGQDTKSTSIAEVASVAGQVEITTASGETRRLSQGDFVQAGDRVRTGADSSAGLWLEEALAQIDENSLARITRGAGGGPRVTLEEGAVRIVDPRESGPAIELVALDTSTEVVGGDLEARILREKAGPYAMICDWEKPLSVVRGDQERGSAPGDCIIANPREPLFAAPGHSDRIPILENAPALASAGPAIDPASLIDPPAALPAVAAGGPGGPMSLGGPLVSSLTDRGSGSRIPGLPLALRSPCGTVGSPCQAGGIVPGPAVVIEQPPGGGACPGGGI